MYQFNRQLEKGEQAEQTLDLYFSKWFQIRKATPQEQRRGIDRIFTDKASKVIAAVEYKADWTASKTGNAFVETVSVDTAGKQGWAYTSQAEYLVYFLPSDRLLYWWSFERFRSCMNTWEMKFPKRKVPNDGYHTHGLLVPLAEFEEHAERIVSL